MILKNYMNNPVKYLALSLNAHNMLLWIPDRVFLPMYHRAVTGKKLDLKRPVTFTEKLQWLKLHDHKPLYTTLVDKFEAKRYIAAIIGEEHIIPTLGVWNTFDEIDFDSLPQQFVLKCTHDSGGLVICRDKETLDKAAAKVKIERCLQKNYYWGSREWPYKNVKPRIIAEQYMEDATVGNRLIDYKYFCFNGEAKFINISVGMEHHPTARMSFYATDGQELPFRRSDYKNLGPIELPTTGKEMFAIANTLAKKIDTDFVRIDLYTINGQIYFSEVTFSPCGGRIPFNPESADRELGDLLILHKNGEVIH